MTQEVLTKVGEIQHAVKEMREAADTNAKRYDTLLEEKTSRIDKDITKLMDGLDKVQKMRNRLPLTSKDVKGREIEISEEEVAHRDAYNTWLRKGDHEDKLKTTQAASPYTKLMQVGDDTAGGFFVPRQVDNEVIQVLHNESPMRQVCRVINLTTPNYVQFVNKRGATTGWVGETEARPETLTPSFGGITPYMGELYAMPKVTQQMLDDASFDVEAFLAAELADEFGIAEGTAFITGSGVKRPLGILSGTIAITADASLSFGTIGAVKTGVNGAFATTSGSVNSADIFYSAVGELKVAYRQGMQWMFNRKMETKVRTLKDGQGNYLWSLNNVQNGWQASLLGISYVLNEDMPDYTGTGANAVLLANFAKAYTIVDRFGIRTLRDPYTAKPYVLFYSTKRVGGMITDTFAVKAIQFAA